MSTITDLISRGDQLLGNRGNLLSLWQCIAEQFHPMRSDFTRMYVDGEDFAAGSMSSYPFLVHRELTSAFSAMLRPTNQQWLTITVDREEELDQEGKAWLEWATGVQSRAMYDPAAQFVRATKTGDGDFGAFGQCVILRERDIKRQTLLYRTYHLRDTAWSEDYAGAINEVHRNWTPKLGQLSKYSGFKLHETLASKVEKEPFRDVRCRHVVMPSEDYEGESKPKDIKKFPWMSVYLDLENKHAMQATPSRSRMYTIPRWAHLGTQYAYSPAVIIGLPEARLIQAMALTLLEAGETAVRPPMLARSEVLRNDAQLYPGGITKVDKEYDERLGEALRPLYENATAGINYGVELMRDSRAQLAEAFYINKLSLPPPDHDMTAYEAGLRTQQWIQQSLPLFEPLETEYNQDICEGTFWDLYYGGAFGNPRDLPRSLQGAEIKFSFESPLRRALEKQKGSQFQEMVNLVLVASQVDKNALVLPDIKTSLRQAIDGMGTPTDWLRDEDAYAKAVEEAAQAAEAAQVSAQMEGAGNAAKAMGEGAQAMNGA